MEQPLSVGSTLDVLTKRELRESLDDHAQHLVMNFARGVKFLRFGPWSATIASNAFSFDGSQTSGTGPREGFVWTIKRLVVTGLATGTTPDIVNFYRGAPTGAVPLWQLNGNSFAATFGKGDLLLLPGEYLSFKNVGSTTATGNVSIAGDVLECAAEEIIKII